ncbi:hypothetical protein CSOJ01_02728 [Colletotrichum sojae]|uniref:Uncharacterized protein n=1 Tax=Colletotrichum sojae TaxID=2175907 RepID=A0A8H6N1E8_9PEZI|nr:hypothetical protein CSOJ01_02728 [Colletotrichum sojae]
MSGMAQLAAQGTSRAARGDLPGRYDGHPSASRFISIARDRQREGSSEHEPVGCHSSYPSLSIRQLLSLQPANVIASFQTLAGFPNRWKHNV